MAVAPLGLFYITQQDLRNRGQSPRRCEIWVQFQGAVVQCRCLLQIMTDGGAYMTGDGEYRSRERIQNDSLFGKFGRPPSSRARLGRPTLADQQNVPGRVP